MGILQAIDDTRKGESIDLAIVVADASNLRRNLLYVSQVIDLKIPVVVALTMVDLAKKRGIQVDVDCLSREMQVPVVVVNARTGKGIEQLKSTVAQMVNIEVNGQDFFHIEALAKDAIGAMRELMPTLSNYGAIHHLINHESFQLNSEIQEKIKRIGEKYKFNHTKIQAEDIQLRYKKIRQVMLKAVDEESIEKENYSLKGLIISFYTEPGATLSWVLYCLSYFRVFFGLLNIQ